MILLVTGWRLGKEVQDDFLKMLEKLVCGEDLIEVVFMRDSHISIRKRHHRQSHKQCFCRRSAAAFPFGEIEEEVSEKI